MSPDLETRLVKAFERMADCQERIAKFMDEVGKREKARQEKWDREEAAEKEGS